MSFIMSVSGNWRGAIHEQRKTSQLKSFFIEYGRLKDVFLRNLAPGYSCILRDVSATSILFIHRIRYECTPAFERNAALEINQIDGRLSKKQDEPLNKYEKYERPAADILGRF